MPELAVFWLSGVIGTWMFGAVVVVWLWVRAGSPRWIQVTLNLRASNRVWDGRSCWVVASRMAEKESDGRKELIVAILLASLLSWFGGLFFGIVTFALATGRGARRRRSLLNSVLGDGDLSPERVESEIARLGLLRSDD